MTRRRHEAVEPGALLGVMFGSAARPALGVALLCLGGVTIAWGWSGFVGGAIGVVLVLAFYGVDLLVLRLTRSLPPSQMTAAVLSEYVVKILLLAALVWWLQGRTSVDLHAMAITVVVTTVAWVVALTATAFRARSFVLDPTPPTVGQHPDADG